MTSSSTSTGALTVVRPATADNVLRTRTLMTCESRGIGLLSFLRRLVSGDTERTHQLACHHVVDRVLQEIGAHEFDDRGRIAGDDKRKAVERRLYERERRIHFRIAAIVADDPHMERGDTAPLRQV